MQQGATPAPIPPWQGWAPILLLPLAVVLFTPGDWPRWVIMWLLGYATFAGCKWLTWRRTPAPEASWRRHIGYLVAWPGLDAKVFLSQAPLPATDKPSALEWASSWAMLAAGSLAIWGLVPWVPSEYALLRGWVAMIGFSMAMHFGAFHIISCAWRAAGVDARPLMNLPLLAEGVSDFWGRRWNMAFRDLTHRFLFRPLTTWLGPRPALAVGFVFSGLIHELVISVPARAGYGWPTAFFVLQVPALFIERSRFGKALGLGKGWRGWLFTAMVLALPAGLLFHPPFVRDVVLPFVDALGVDRHSTGVNPIQSMAHPQAALGHLPR